VATALILVMPPLVLGRGCRGIRRDPLSAVLFVYRTGYILIEVGLIQKFVLFWTPTYALTVVIFSLLTSSGWEASPAGGFWQR